MCHGSWAIGSASGKAHLSTRGLPQGGGHGWGLRQVRAAGCTGGIVGGCGTVGGLCAASGETMLAADGWSYPLTRGTFGRRALCDTAARDLWCVLLSATARDRTRGSPRRYPAQCLEGRASCLCPCRVTVATSAERHCGSLDKGGLWGRLDLSRGQHCRRAGGCGGAMVRHKAKPPMLQLLFCEILRRGTALAAARTAVQCPCRGTSFACTAPHAQILRECCSVWRACRAHDATSLLELGPRA